MEVDKKMPQGALSPVKNDFDPFSDYFKNISGGNDYSEKKVAPNETDPIMSILPTPGE